MSNKNNGATSAQAADTPKGNDQVKTKISDIISRLTHFQELEALVNQRRLLEAHRDQLSESLKEMKSAKFTDETSKNEVHQITLQLGNSRYDNYVIKNAVLLIETVEFMKAKFDAKIEEIDAEILKK